ncbi:MOSC domain-containing protein [Pseudonocardia sp.]|uniref:MOSC domain-containing protein n=1 Tax=Pseudonocardia sp. TaxID=60912 RepID=UPI0025DB0800|nr:MOSC domain-containing protein [Pseudonocardia sp.]
MGGPAGLLRALRRRAGRRRPRAARRDHLPGRFRAAQRRSRPRRGPLGGVRPSGAPGLHPARRQQLRGALARHRRSFDLAVLHVLTDATLDHLRELAPDATFDVRRYRPNVVLDGDDSGFTENGWPGRGITLGDGPEPKVSITVMRCVMTTLAQSDLPADVDTLRTIAKHNRLEIPGMGVWACAGVYADVTAGGSVSVGDAYVVS